MKITLYILVSLLFLLLLPELVLEEKVKEPAYQMGTDYKFSLIGSGKLENISDEDTTETLILEEWMYSPFDWSTGNMETNQISYDLPADLKRLNGFGIIIL